MCLRYQENLVESKHHKLARSLRSGPSDRDLKPNAATRDQLNVGRNKPYSFSQLVHCKQPKLQQAIHHKIGVGKTPRRLIRKRCRYSSLEKFEDTFDTELDLMQKTQAFRDKWQSAGNPAIGGRSCFFVLWLLLQWEWRQPQQTMTFVEICKNRLSANLLLSSSDVYLCSKTEYRT